MVLGLVVFAVVLIVGAPLWSAVVAGLLVYALRAMTAARRRQRRAERVAERARRREAGRAARKVAIRERTGLDVDLVGRAAQDAVRSVGTRVTKRLEARYPDPAATPTASGGDWLDLDTDLGTLRSRTQTDEALRLSDELSRARRRG